MTAWLRRNRRKGRGQTLAEFALILPVFLMLTLAVVDGARVYMAQIELTNGVRSAALFAVKGNYNSWCRDPGDPSAADPSMPVSVPCPSGTSAANYGSDPGNLAYRIAADAQGMDIGQVTLDRPLCGAGPGLPTSLCSAVTNPKYITVRATYTFPLITPMLAQIWGSSIVLTATSTGRVDI